MKKILLSLCVGSLLFASCKDDKDDIVCNLDNTGLQGAYKITASTYKPDATSGTQDVYAAMPACAKDDIYTLGANFQLTVADAGVVCNPTTAATGTWALTGSNQLFIAAGSNIDIMGTVSNYSCSGMTITETDAGTGEVWTITVARQ